MLLKEQWKAVSGYEGLYEVSSYGRVRSLDWMVFRSKGQYQNRAWRHKGRILSSCGHPYRVVVLRKNRQSTMMYVHKLVATAFLGPPFPGAEINHKQPPSTNNHVTNLEWVSHQDNMQHSIETGLRKLVWTRNKGLITIGEKHGVV